jgi:hypothetical protein
VYFHAANLSYSLDGGLTSEGAGFPGFGPLTALEAPGYDHHDMWIDPTNGDRMISGHDGGLSISWNRGKSWLRQQLPVAQMYHVTVDNHVPYNVLGNRQDGPSYRGPSRAFMGGFFDMGIPRGMWHEVGGGESGFATPDPLNPDIVWSSASGTGARGGIVVRYNEKTRQFFQTEVWPESTGGWPAEELKYRFQWTFPLLISPHDNNMVFVTSQHVHRTTDGGQSWEVISPDLTTNDKSKQGISGGLTPDNIGVEYCCVIYAFDESPAQQGVFWAGSNDGLVHVSRDGGDTWDNVTGNIPGLPPLGTVRNINASKWDAGKAYVTIDFHQVGNFDPFIYKTEDFGESWTKITAGIPLSPLSYARNIREDPVRPGLLYAGTENALYISFDDGANWQSLHTNLPHTPMYWIAVQEHFNDLVLGTYGRGFWILDDLSPLQQLTPEVMDAAAHLFEPRQAYRFQPITPPEQHWQDPSAGQNPPYGAALSYWLAEKPEGALQLHVLDAAGDTVRTLSGSASAGINRVWWNLRGEPSTQIKLRTKPLHADWVQLGDERWRPAPTGRISVLVPPGTYTVALSVNDQTFTQPLEVLKDPNSEGTPADITAQTEMMQGLREDMNAAAELVNRIEWVRRQLYDQKAILLDQGDAEEIVEAADALDAELLAVEQELLQLKLTGTGQDAIRWPAMHVGKLNHLASGVAVADFGPTDSEREVHALLKDRFRGYEAEVNRILETGLVNFNRLLQERGLPNVIAVGG